MDELSKRLKENMTKPLEADLKALHKCALIVATKLIAELTDSQQTHLSVCVAGGGRLILELGPLPDLLLVRVVLVEREGSRQNVCSISVTPETMQ
ncbi:hypothetical protein SBP18_14405 [Rhodoferax ferrireducens]|uniref:hypothetical protein n=1 Tax=Rhodoferax ferrireducens TaxID=192843 RepID=UPI00298E0F9A|nr:hypothetical protein [Rhodoferax ferrireducens]WPC65675.1 hypothetical protein SBP18_14405 [Rhodoferax ferrireducens]